MKGKAMHSILSAPSVGTCPPVCPGAACCPTAA